MQYNGEKQLFPLKGIVTVLNTPFDQNNALDIRSLERNVLYALDAGVSGFLVPAMASEVYKLSFEERMEMVSTVKNLIGNQALLIAGAGEPDEDKRKKIIESYLSLGCTNILVQIPYSGDAAFRKAIEETAALGPEMLMIQDWDASGYGLPDELILRLFEEIECFRSLKVETVPAGLKYSRLLQKTAGRLHLSGGWAVGQMIEGLKRGIHAFMPTGMHRIYVEIFSLYEMGHYKEANALFESILPVLAFSNQHLDISIHFFKRLLHAQGYYATPLVRQPILSFDAIHEEIANQLIRRVMKIEAQLQIKPMK
ncbi:MAG: dihydrodipicolinate synthase family protein [Cyclobacteriaceae bacterium]|nr:dihydrodipicolinate synthase family protein [Cyclobacteriaceae bacterium]